MHRNRRLPFALAVLLFATPAAAEDVRLELGSGDDFVVEDGSALERLRIEDSNQIEVQGTTQIRWTPAIGGSDRDVALAISTGSAPGNPVHPLMLFREDNGRGTIFTNPGGILTSGYIVVDGSVNVTYDPLTHKMTWIDAGGYADPDGGGGLAAMGVFGADVETAVILRASNVSVNGRTAKLLLALDKEQDWVYEIERDGTTCWGSPTEKGLASFDVCLERVDDAGFEHPRFVLNGDDTPVNVDIKAPLVQGTGSPSNGPMLWGDGSTLSSGDAVCAASSLACQTTFTMAGANQACSFGHGDYFYALCR